MRKGCARRNPAPYAKSTFLNNGLRGITQGSQRALVHLLQNQALAIVDSSDDAIYANTLDGLIVGWNRAAERIYGYTAREIVGKPSSLLAPSDLQSELPPIMQHIKLGKGVDQYETVGIRKDGRRINVSVTISPILDQNGRVLGASAIARDITAQKRSQESTRYLATHDPLTDLTNYSALMEALSAELRRSRRTGHSFALLMLDVDRLKEINDTYGHMVGSEVLCRLGALLKRTCRSTDTAARYGGDEFAVLLVETDAGVAAAAAQRIADLLKKDPLSPKFTVTMGISIYPQDGDNIEHLLTAADRALYKNKLRALLKTARTVDDMRYSNTLPAQMAGDRRRSERLILDVPLVVRGESAEGNAFQESTFTISVSAHGTSLVLATKVSVGQVLFLQNPDIQQTAEGRVVRCGTPYGGLTQVGIEFARPTPELWPVDPLPVTWRCQGMESSPGAA